MEYRIIEKRIRARKYWFLQNNVDGVWMTLQQFQTLDEAIRRRLQLI